MQEYDRPVRHKRFRVSGDDAHLGKELDLTMTAEGSTSCLHVLLDQAPVAATLQLRIGDATHLVPCGLCGACAVVAGLV